jgi:hypothetical protein
MNKKIFKYTLKVDGDLQKILMDNEGEILTVQIQNDEITMWVLVNPEKNTEERYFEVFGTGHSIYYDMGIDRKYINTCQDSLGLVWHVFERTN